jgi:hypothetical protein
MTTHPLTADPRPLARDGLLRGALKVDAFASIATGLAYLVLNSALGDLFGLPGGFLAAVGVFSVAYGAYAWRLGTHPRLAASAGVLIAIGNLVWVAASVAMVVLGWHDPTTAGSVWIAAQAALVAGFADAQLLGARRMTTER